MSDLLHRIWSKVALKWTSFKVAHELADGFWGKIEVGANIWERGFESGLEKCIRFL